MQETLKEIAAIISGLASIALVIRGCYHRRRGLRAAAAARMRFYGKRRPGTVKRHQQRDGSRTDPVRESGLQPQQVNVAPEGQRSAEAQPEKQ